MLPDMTAGVGAGPSAMQIGQDIAPHKYYSYFRGDSAFASLDGFSPESNVVSQFQSGAFGPLNNVLPLTFLIISNGGASGNLQINATFLAGNNLVTNNAVGNYPSAPTMVTPAAADTAIAPVNANRVQLIVSNNGTGNLYLLVDPSGTGAASATNYTYFVPINATFEFPNPVSTARVRGFWSATGGTCAVTDISIGSTGL